MITSLEQFIVALDQYTPGAPGANKALQDAMANLVIPAYVNMKNAKVWAQSEIARLRSLEQANAQLEVAQLEVKQAYSQQRKVEHENKKLLRLVAALQERLCQNT